MLHYVLSNIDSQKVQWWLFFSVGFYSTVFYKKVLDVKKHLLRGISSNTFRKKAIQLLKTN